ncbi:transmembrane amino acid transporter protein-domain-containing protein [Fomes fomentarius]|nr:transmembrane amino acid transporter protein-domain-containing protein [Fomes fomentarius]
MTSPSKPFSIPNPRRGGPLNAEGTPVSGTPNFGTSLSASPSPRFLRAQYTGTPPPPNVPPGTPRLATTYLPGSSGDAGSSSPRLTADGFSARRPTPGTPGSDNPFDELTDEDKARVVRRHLVSREERQNVGTEQVLTGSSSRRGSDSGNLSSRSSNSQLRIQREDTEPFPVSYDAPGADVTHSIYKWQADKRRQAARPRSASFAGSTHTQQLHPALEHIREPGGFRRAHVVLNDPERASERPMVRNFIEFLYIFGHFAGEDLEEIEEEDEDELADEEAYGTETTSFFQGGPSYGTNGLPAPSFTIAPSPSTLKSSERSPLLERRSRSHSRRRAASVGAHGDATVTDAVLMLLKAFVGTGILFLGKAFFNGGILFSSAILTFIALISLYSFLLLVKTKFVVSGSFGDIGGTLYGPWMRYAILSSIAVSQLGFVSAYIIFVAENLQSFVLAITNCAKLLGIQYFILLQMIIFLPLALLRNLAKLSTTALIADAFILAGLIYIFGSEAMIMARNGHAHVELFNPKDWPLLIGTAVFSFEGIGLVIPITDAMKEPRKFPPVLTGVMLFLMVLFCGGGVMSYLTFGADVQTVVIVNLDTTSKFTQAVQFLYSLAIMLSVPLQLFPAVRIMENGIFERSGKQNPVVKWQKNFFRFCVVVFCAGLSYFGAADLDKFVSFVGSFAWLLFDVKSMLHYKIARTRKEKIADIALMIFGTIAAAYTTVQTVRLMVAPAPAEPPVLGQCGRSPEDLLPGLSL